MDAWICDITIRHDGDTRHSGARNGARREIFHPQALELRFVCDELGAAIRATLRGDAIGGGLVESDARRARHGEQEAFWTARGFLVDSRRSPGRASDECRRQA